MSIYDRISIKKPSILDPVVNHLQQDGIIHIFAEHFKLFAVTMESTKIYLVTSGS